jgi:hypothetical protein
MTCSDITLVSLASHLYPDHVKKGYYLLGMSVFFANIYHLLFTSPLLPGPAKTLGPVQPKKLGRWRKNWAANLHPKDQHFIQCK